MRGDLIALGVQRHDNRFRSEALNGYGRQFRLPDDHRPQNHACGSRVEGVRRVVQGAQPTAKLHRQPHGCNRVQGFEGQRCLAQRAVEVDDVQPCRPGVPPVGRHRGGVVPVDRFLIRIAVLQAHDAALANINGGIDDHHHSSTKFLRMRSPTAWLFSGCGWMPKTFCRATTDTKSIP